MKKIISLALAAITLVVAVCLVGCTVYSSSFKATMCVHSNKSNSSYLSFSTFEGKMVFKMKCDDGDQIKYYAKLESGDAAVYYDCGGGKTELLKVGAGEEISERGGELSKGTVYVIVETDGKCSGGDFDFDIVKG